MVYLHILSDKEMLDCSNVIIFAPFIFLKLPIKKKMYIIIILHTYHKFHYFISIMFLNNIELLLVFLQEN